ncbi:MAG: acetate--CoA ligase family protein [Pseudomonadota bacterium]
MPDLARLLKPRSVAVIGGGRWGEAVIAACRAIGFEGALHAVHPARDSLAGVACVADIAALPQAPDAAFIAVNAAASVEAVAALSARGTGGAVCFASGFAETAGGARLQDALVEAAGEMALLGPNGYGFLNWLDRVALWPDVQGGRPVARGVGLVAQSSNLLLTLTMQRRGLPLAMAVAAGNQAQTGAAEIAAAMLADPRITAVGLHIEGAGPPLAWEALAETAHTLAKPVVALRVGRSEAGRRAALSHTASMTGTEAAGRAFFARLGVAQVETLPAFIETLKLAHIHGALPGRRVVSLSCSGGEAALVGDAAERAGVALPGFAPARAKRLQALLGPEVAATNPLDYHTRIWGQTEAMTAVFTEALSEAPDLGLLVYDRPRPDRCAPDPVWDAAVEALKAAAQASATPTALLASLPESLDEAAADALIEARIAPLAGIEEAMHAVAALSEVGRALAVPRPMPLAAPAVAGGTPVGLDERLAKLSLATHGVPVPEGRFAATPTEAAEAGEDLGYPVVLKALGVAHKSEKAAVALALEDAAAVQSAAERMAAPEGYLVETMLCDGVAELICSVLADPHGLVLTLGAGGIETELMADTATLLLPCAATEIRAALDTLRTAPRLYGFRARPPADMAALVETVLAIQKFALTERERLIELEINPLIVTPTRAVAADALVVLAERSAP